MPYVVDASVAVKWFVQEDLRDAARELVRGGHSLHAPDWVVIEVGHAALKKWLAGQIDPAQARTMIRQLPAMIAHLYESTALIERALTIAMTTRHPVYDCLYLACAEISGGVVVTADQRFCQSVADTPFADQVRHLNDVVS